MKFLGDMGISGSTIHWLLEQGFPARHLRNLGLQKLLDSDILRLAREENEIILTCDLDFGTLLAHSKDSLPSIILFRLENERPENINKHLAIVLNNFKIELLKGCIISVTEKKYRIRELPFNP
ncbi:MAG: DUF5615 family PIN-like protein [Leptospiraceae bacterium]|nr:DUF5615 family PIN-like protein [Leptospiraceae bacterium]